MAKFTGTGMQQRLSGFMEMVGKVLGSDENRASFAMYVHGLLGEGARKSIEPIAARASGDEKRASGAHQRLHHFVANSGWDDAPVRLSVARCAIAAMERQAPIDAWIIDDTGFLKQGKCSVGVQRQYTGSAGKIANSQVAVSLSVASASAHLPVDFELFLPESWLNDPARRLKGKIPADAVFKTKHELALDHVERAAVAGLPGRTILADSFYGHSQPFRDHVDLLGFDYAVGIYATDTMQRVDRNGRRYGALRSARDIAHALGKQSFRKCTWREGTRASLSSRFALVRVVVPRDDGVEPRTEWLLIEWPDGEKEPTRYTLTTLPRTMSKKRIVRMTKERYRTEQVYEEMKGEVGLDHFEGRGYPGWNHHVTLALCCYAFLVSERVSAFSPSARGTDQADAICSAA